MRDSSKAISVGRDTRPGDEELEHRFRQACVKYAEMLAADGAQVRPYRAPALPLFSAHSEEGKREILSRIELALEIFEQTLAEGHRLSDSPKLLWRAFRKMGWTPRPDVFDKMADEDVVCLYSLDQRQVFQNLRFFDWVSITLEDLYCEHWTRYSRRDPAMQQGLYEMAVKVMTGQIDETVDPGLPEHLIEEVDSAELLRFRLRVRYMSPIKQDGKIVGGLVINRCRAE